MNIEVIKVGTTREREIVYHAGQIIHYGDTDIVIHEPTIIPVTEVYQTQHPNKWREWVIALYHVDRARPVPPPPPPEPGWFSRLLGWLTGQPKIPTAKVVKE